MRPNDFKLNTDYLSLATATNFSATVSFAGGIIAGNSIQSQSVDLTAPHAENVITRYMISTDGNNWITGGDYSFSYSNNVAGRFKLQRETSDIIRAYLFIGNGSSSQESFSAKTFYIKEATIYTPDMV